MYKYLCKYGVLFPHASKFFLIMRLTTIIILSAIMQVSASTYAQRITLNESNASISNVLDKIIQQSGYQVVADGNSLAKSIPVNISVKNVSLEEALAISFKNQPFTYEVKDKMVIIKTKEPSLLDKFLNRLSNIDVTGRLVDPEGNPISRATITIKGTSRSALSNTAGEFTLKNVDENAHLQISYVGYQSLEIAARANLGNIILHVTNSNLDEVTINAGYYMVSDKERTGAISKITAIDIEKQPVNNVLQAMEANIPGVEVTQTTGVPGGGFTVRVRGQNSLTQGNDPLYIIDGVQFPSQSLSHGVSITTNASPMASINPADIESIEVLKDADATAIYGSRGANGVVLITTKRGKAGKTRSSFSLNQGISKVNEKLDLMNTTQYIAMRKKALVNDNVQIAPTDYDINGTWDPNRNLDWQKELIGKAAPTTNMSTSLSGGTANVTYLVGANYYREGTVFPGDNSFKRTSGNFSLQYTSDNKKLTASFDANYSQINSNLFLYDLTGEIFLPPNYPALVDAQGNLNWGNGTMHSNPIALTQQPFNAKTNNFIANTAVSYAIIPDLKIKASIGYNQLDRNEFNTQPLITYDPSQNPGPSDRISVFTNNSTNNWVIESQANYEKKIGGNKISALIGTTLQQGITEAQSVTGSGYNSDALLENIAAASLYSANASYAKYRYISVYGRLNYILNDKYIFNATARRDGSSRFGTQNQFANFGAIGAAWLISDEKFIKEKLGFVNFIKLRGSYGITGNDQIPDYGYLDLWRTNAPYQGVSTTYPGTLQNSQYAWEVNKKTEAALDFGLLKSRINVSIDYYTNKSSNQLVSIPLPLSTGFSGITNNLGATVGNRGWELELRTINIQTKSFTYSSTFNLTVPKNKLINFPGLANSAYASIYVVGQPISIQKLYNTSVDPISGVYIEQDYDKNGIIDDNDRYIVAFIGRKFYGGLNNSIYYKGFSLDVLMQFVKQSANGYLTQLKTPGSFQPGIPEVNQPSLLKNNYWQNPGDNSLYQKYSGSSEAVTSFSDATFNGKFAVVDASFIRLKNVSLSYNLPLKMMQKLNLNSAKIYIQGQNLLTITKYKGLDPETQSVLVLPMLRVFSLGAQFTL
ncbi:SusC/RagA family TonB-linked outer membrane protein [Pedobacter sp. L105]|uniref:SusC/RagA family TonB-linked outer membrane protein n=1 Tax=Pedobacter sp. L105 TaxID=1641871 RepID=UPI00131DE42D|nr:SusC/RagA family TonB-linked outer membrane protein [Pedobacter sp. L105]